LDLTGYRDESLPAVAQTSEERSMVAESHVEDAADESAALITITPAAAEQVRLVLAQQAQPDAAVRVFIAGRSCSGFQYGMALAGGPDADDVLVEQGGIRLIVDQVSAPLLQGARIDFVDTVMQRGFTIISAGTESGGGGCACGRGGCGCH
jgi:iron-sulfur cluster assembly accessory protein